MVEIKRERPRAFDLNDLELEKIAPKSEVKQSNDGVDNFKKWFKEMKK